MGINSSIDFLCDNNGVVSFSKVDGQPRIEVAITFLNYGLEETTVRSIGATLEAAMRKVPATVECKKKRPMWKRNK